MVPAEEPPAGTSLARRIDALFRTGHRHGRAGDYTYEQVSTAIAERGGPTISASYLYMLRRGIRDNPTKRHLEALAEFFDVPVSYFFDPPAGATPTPPPDPAALAAITRPDLADLVVHAARLSPEALAAVGQLLSQLRPAPVARAGPQSAGPQSADPQPVPLRPAPPQPGRDTEGATELAYARVALANGEPDSARKHLTALLAGGDLPRRLTHEAAKLLAEAHERLNDLGTAIRLLQPVYEECLAGRSHLSLPAVAYPLCHYHLLVGDPATAIQVGERGVQASEDAGLAGTDEHLKLEATLMGAYYESDDLSRAWARFEQILQRAQRAGSATGQGAAYWNAALVAEARGDSVQALRLSERALALWSEAAGDRDLTRLQYMVGWFILVADPSRAPEAARLLDQVAAAVHANGSDVDRAEWESYRSLAHLLSGELPPAERLARRAVLHLQQLGDHRLSARALITLGDALLAQGRSADGLARYRAAAETLGSARPHRRVASLYREIAHRFALAGEQGAALHCVGLAFTAAQVPYNAAAGELAFGLRAPAQRRGAAPAGDTARTKPLTRHPADAPQP